MISKKHMAAILFAGVAILSPQFANAGEFLRRVKAGDFLSAAEFLVDVVQFECGVACIVSDFDLSLDDAVKATFENKVFWNDKCASSELRVLMNCGLVGELFCDIAFLKKKFGFQHKWYWQTSDAAKYIAEARRKYIDPITGEKGYDALANDFVRLAKSNDLVGAAKCVIDSAQNMQLWWMGKRISNFSGMVKYILGVAPDFCIGVPNFHCRKRHSAFCRAVDAVKNDPRLRERFERITVIVTTFLEEWQRFVSGISHYIRKDLERRSIFPSLALHLFQEETFSGFPVEASPRQAVRDIRDIYEYGVTYNYADQLKSFFVYLAKSGLLGRGLGFGSGPNHYSENFWHFLEVEQWVKEVLCPDQISFLLRNAIDGKSLEDVIEEQSAHWFSAGAVYFISTPDEYQWHKEMGLPF
ncbi:hypothetical protein HOD08_00440 [bacterium]|nr:hypothetical protein [bacterium]